MRLMDSGLGINYVMEERRLAFEQFVKEKRARGYAGSGKEDTALHNIGYRDSFGPVVYEQGLRKGRWIMPDSQNSNVLVFTNRDEALTYGKSLLPILSLYGYIFSKVWVDEVAVHMVFPHPYTGSKAPGEIFDEKDRYVLRIKVQ